MTDLQTTELEDFATSAGNGKDFMFHGVGVSLTAKGLILRYAFLYFSRYLEYDFNHIIFCPPLSSA